MFHLQQQHPAIQLSFEPQQQVPKSRSRDARSITSFNLITWCHLQPSSDIFSEIAAFLAISLSSDMHDKTQWYLEHEMQQCHNQQEGYIGPELLDTVLAETRAFLTSYLYIRNISKIHFISGACTFISSTCKKGSINHPLIIPRNTRAVIGAAS